MCLLLNDIQPYQSPLGAIEMTAKEVKIKMLEKDVRQVEVARLYGCTPQAVNIWINGPRSRGLCHFMANLLEVDYVDLVTMEEANNETT